MAKYYFTNEAVDDLTEIWNYTFDAWSEKQADFYYKLILGSCNEIAKLVVILLCFAICISMQHDMIDAN